MPVGNRSDRRRNGEGAVRFRRRACRHPRDCGHEFIDFLEGRPNTVDGVIAFAQGPAVELFGKEAADQILAEQTARKERGEKYCDCAACTAAVELLSKFGRI